jgi:predicted TIM-barrel fold metal-dependent hydrolase
MAPDPQDDDITLTGNLTLAEILSGPGGSGSDILPPPDLRPNDGHCHFFSTRFFELLGQQLRTSGGVTADALCRHLGWDHPGTPDALADRWITELDRHGVRRAMLIGSLPGDEGSVAAAVARHPGRIVGAFMVNPMAPDALIRIKQALGSGLRVVCLFPAMHRYALAEPKVSEVVAATATSPGTALFVHCGVLSVGVRKRLGLASRFEMRFGQPLDVQRLAVDFPHLPIIVPHFGAGFFREALMLADACPNVVLDTSSSNGWLRYHPGLTLTEVFRTALAIAGPHRLLFGTDSSFFPRGWVSSVHQTQQAILDDLGVDEATKAAIFFGTFDRLFPV